MICRAIPLCVFLSIVGWQWTGSATHVVGQEDTTQTRSDSATAESALPTGLTMTWQERFLEIHGDQIPGGVIRTHYLEAYCRPGSTNQDWAKTVIRHDSQLVFASDDGKRIEIEDRLEDGVIVRHVIEAGADDVSFTVTATNPTGTASEVHWAQPCTRVDAFTGTDPKDSRLVQPAYIRKCFVMIDDRLTRLPTLPWATEALYTPGQVYVPKNVDRNDVNPRPLSESIPSSGLTGCYSEDETMVLGIAWQPIQEVFQGVITCIHADFRIAGLDPGESKIIRGKMYVLPAEDNELLKRYRRDFPGDE